MSNSTASRQQRCGLLSWHCSGALRYARVLGASSLFFLTSLASTSSLGTTILGLDIDEVAAQSELVFEGQVILSDTRLDNGNQISTYITFQIDDVLKGEYSADSIELKFLGGALNGRIAEVSGLVFPKLGERGVYFVESTSENLVNPLLGWSQGHYLIESDDQGVDRMRASDLRPITAVQAMAAVPRSIRRPNALSEGSGGVATGISVDNDTQRIDRAMTASQFKQRIRDLVE